MNRFWDDLAGRQASQGRYLRPAVDISETESAVRVTVELPGLAKEDVKITVEDGVLSISGEKRFEEEAPAEGKGRKDRTYHRIERFYGAFQRSLTLPRGVDANAAEASFQNGVLTIELPKTEEVKPRTLRIK
jgi:HSP20 family protein